MKSLVKRVLILSLCATLPLSIATAAPTSALGGGSDGGGNTYRGKPLESYAKNPVTLPAFQKLLAPILADLQSKASNANSLNVLQNLMLSVFTQKIWYFVPGPLDQIPPNLINSPVGTTQAALQGFDRVWIDEDNWNTMNVEDQAKLLVHEAFMGLKILRFASSQRLCQAAYTTAYDCSDDDAVDGLISLAPGDYTDVQKMTIQVSAQFASMSNDDWMNLIQLSGLVYPYDWFERKVMVTPAQLAQLLVKSTVSGFLPTRGFNGRTFDTDNHPPIKTQQDLYDWAQKHKETCQVKASVSGTSLHLQVQGVTDSFDEVIPLPAQMESRFNDLFKEKRVLQEIGFLYNPGRVRPDGGYTVYNMSLGFGSYHLSSVYIQEMVCTDKDCSEPYIDVKGGMMYICSDNDQLFKP